MEITYNYKEIQHSVQIEFFCTHHFYNEIIEFFSIANFHDEFINEFI